MKAKMTISNNIKIDAPEHSDAEIMQFPENSIIPNSSTHYAELAAAAASLKGKPIKEAANRGQEIFGVNPFLIEIEPGFNCRDYSLKENQEWVERLSQMIEAEGVQEPLTLFQRKEKPGIYFLADGECRLRATIMALERGAPIKTVPAKLEKRLTSEAERIFAQWRRNSGKNFTAMEMAVAFKRCLDFGYEVEEISKRSGMSIQRIEQILDFDANATTTVKEAVSNGEISVTLAATLVNNSKTAVAAEQAIKKAVATAKAKGKAKATAKDVSGDVGVKLNMKRHLVEIVERATVKSDGDIVTLKMHKEDYDLMMKALGLR